MNLQPKKIGLRLGHISVVAVLMMVFVMGLLKIYSPDLGFHLKSAEWMIENRQFIYTDPFSYGTEGHRYVDLQWLYQLITYKLYQSGEAVLIIANAMLISISVMLVLFRFVKKTETDHGNFKLGCFAFITALFVQPLSFETRPQVFSWVFLNLVLILLESYKKGNKKALFVLPVVMMLWANTHSLAILGLVIIAIYNAGIFFETTKTDKTLFLFSALSFAAFIVTPYFINGFFFSLSQYSIISGNSLFKSYLGELQSPFTAREIKLLGAGYFTSPLLIIHLSALFSLFSIIRSLLQKEFVDALLLIAFFILLIMAHRNYGIFILVSLPLFIKYLLNWLESGKRPEPEPKNQRTGNRKNAAKQQLIASVAVPANQKLFKRLSIAAIIIAVLVSITSVTDGYNIFRHSPYRFGFTEDDDQLPVEATVFLNEKHIKGKLLNHLDFGGYLMGHYNEKVFIDGRMELFGEDFFEKYYESLTEKNGLKKLLTEYDPDLIVFPYIKAANWWYYFIINKGQSGYKAVYFDGLSVIYVKSSRYPQLKELSENDITGVVDQGAATRIDECIATPKPGKLMALINGLWKKQSFSIANQNKATWCFTNRFDTAGIIYSVIGIENSTVQTPNIFKNLAIYFRDKKMYNQADICEARSE